MRLMVCCRPAPSGARAPQESRHRYSPATVIGAGAGIGVGTGAAAVADSSGEGAGTTVGFGLAWGCGVAVFEQALTTAAAPATPVQCRSRRRLNDDPPSNGDAPALVVMSLAPKVWRTDYGKEAGLLSKQEFYLITDGEGFNKERQDESGSDR